MNLRELRQRQEVFLRLPQHCLNLGQLLDEHPCDDGDLLLEMSGECSSGGRTNRRGDLLVAVPVDQENSDFAIPESPTRASTRS